MKQVILTAILMTVAMSHIFSQSFEVGLATGIGIAGTNIDGQSEWIPEETHTYYSAMELILNYRFLANKKIKPFIGSGLNFSNNKYYQDIQSLEYGYNVGEIHFTQKHISVPIRLGLDVDLFGGNSFGLQYELQYNRALKKEELYSGNGTAIFGSLSYNYALNNRTRNYVSNIFSMYLRTKITTQLHLFTSVGYAIIPVTGDYDFNTDQLQRLTDTGTGIETQIPSSYGFEKEDIKNNIIIFKIGVTREF